VRLLGRLRGTRLGWRTGSGLNRNALLAGLMGVTVGAALLTTALLTAALLTTALLTTAGLTAAPARAANVPPGDNLSLTTASGAAKLEPRWYTQDGCPSGFQGSAVLDELNADGSIGRSISPVVTGVSAPFGGTLLGTVGQLITQGTDVGDGGTSEWVVACFAGPGATGNVDYLQWIDVTLSGNGQSFWTRTPRPVATTVTLTASPDPVAAGATVTLTATVKAADGSIPRGEVTFLLGFSLIFIAPVNASGVATATTTFAADGAQARTVSLGAYFSGLIGAYEGSAGRCTETVNAPGSGGGGNGGNSEPITVTVPHRGAFTVTITPGTVILSAPDRVAASGRLLDITVTDLRNDQPGWSVSGQESDFTGSGAAAGATISGNQLGWTPFLVPPRGVLVPSGHVSVPQEGVIPGPPVAPADPGLGTTAAILASAKEGWGFGTYVLSALVVLDIPPAAAGGPYGGTLTITAVEAAP
jgi:hypothetical protein